MAETLDVTQLTCVSAVYQGGDNGTHHLVPRAAGMTCAYCKKTAERIRAEYTFDDPEPLIEVASGRRTKREPSRGFWIRQPRTLAQYEADQAARGRAS